MITDSSSWIRAREARRRAQLPSSVVAACGFAVVLALKIGVVAALVVVVGTVAAIGLVAIVVIGQGRASLARARGRGESPFATAALPFAAIARGCPGVRRPTNSQKSLDGMIFPGRLTVQGDGLRWNCDPARRGDGSDRRCGRSRGAQQK
jgi:hypothetical protein